MATKKAAPAKKTAAPKPVTYLETVMFPAVSVKNKDASKDNMEDLSPICVNNVLDGEVVAVYKFVGVQKVSKVLTLVDPTAAELKAALDTGYRRW